MSLFSYLFLTGYMFYAKSFINEILTKTKPLLRANGGPIIMVQVSLKNKDDSSHKYPKLNLFSALNLLSNYLDGIYCFSFKV